MPAVTIYLGKGRHYIAEAQQQYNYEGTGIQADDLPVSGYSLSNQYRQRINVSEIGENTQKKEVTVRQKMLQEAVCVATYFTKVLFASGRRVSCKGTWISDSITKAAGFGSFL